jgi:predicted RND superfamily exporter protein
MSAATVQLLQRIQQKLQQHRAVGKILSVVNFTELARQVNQDRPLTEYELTALYWTLEDALRKDLLGAFFNPQHAQVRFSVRIQDSTEGLNRAELLAELHNDLKTLGLAENSYSLSNLFVLYQDILQKLFRSQILTMGIVYAVLLLTFLAIFRSFKVALIGLAPNVLSTLMVLGVMGWLGIPLDLMTITIAAIAMGIAVDDTIHYIHRYLEELQEHPADQAVERSHASVGYAVLYTSLIIVLGFSLMAFSDFVPSVLFGLLTGLAMLVALVFALCLLPALLHQFVQGSRTVK